MLLVSPYLSYMNVDIAFYRWDNAAGGVWNGLVILEAGHLKRIWLFYKQAYGCKRQRTRGMDLFSFIFEQIKVGIWEEILALYFHQIRIRKWVGVSCSSVAGLLFAAQWCIVGWWAMSGLGLVLEMQNLFVCDVDWYGVSGLWSCPKCDAWWFSQLEVPGVDWLFKLFYSYVRDRIGPEKLLRESSWLVEKRPFLLECPL